MCGLMYEATELEIFWLCCQSKIQTGPCYFGLYEAQPQLAQVRH